MLYFCFVKRIVSIFLTSLYIVSCLGIGISRVYCCGKLTSVSLLYSVTETKKESSGKKPKCCRQEKVNFKIKDSHLYSATLPANLPFSFVIPYTTGIPDLFNQITVVYQIRNRGNDPPTQAPIPAYTLNCTYRI